MLYLHIGFRKTGSTTIQSFVKQNAATFASAGLIYPEVGLAGRAHFNLVNEIRGEKLFLEERGSLSDLRALVSENEAANYLISSEALHSLPPRQVRAFSDALPDIPVLVIAYIRNFVHLIVSSYMQTAKNGQYMGDFDHFFSRRVEGDAQDYSRKIFEQLGNWAAVYGWPAMRVRVLEPENLVGGDLLTDFLAAVGLNWRDLGHIPKETLASRNVSPGWKTVELIREIQAHVGELPSPSDTTAYRRARSQAYRLRKGADVIAEDLGLNAERGSYLTREQWEIAETAYAEVIKMLNGYLADPLPAPKHSEVKPRPFLPEVSRILEDERADFYRRMAFLLATHLREASENSGPPADKTRPAPGSEAMREARREQRKLERKAERKIGHANSNPAAPTTPGLNR